ncbi:hypothetical protein BH11CYA1_BH11CYA1_41850 [soil metagenome]
MTFKIFAMAGIITACFALINATNGHAVFAQAPGNSVDYKTPHKKIEDLPNFHCVHPYLYRGGEPTQKGLQQLQEKGMKTLIDLRATSPITKKEEATAHELGMKYINLPMSSKAPTEAQLSTYLEAVRTAREKNEPVFLHCAHGSDRTGCLVGIWRVTEDGYSYPQAYTEMRKYWFGPQFKELSGAVLKRSTKLSAAK